VKQYTATIEEDENGEAILVFPEGSLPEDWVEGTTIQWIDNKDGTWTLKKKDDKKLESRKD